jgi:thioredoxin reductase (NADPH)
MSSVATSEVLNVVVVGGGPAGLSVAVECQRAGIGRVVVLEKGDTHNYMISKLYTRGKRVDAVWKGIVAEPEGALWLEPGSRETYLRTMQEFIDRYELDIRYNQEVWGVKKEKDGLFQLQVNGKALLAKTVVIAIGVMGRPNKPDYRLPKALEPRIHFNIARKLKNERVLVVGGGDSASEAVQYLYPWNEVVLSYRGEEFTRMNALNEKILLELEKSQEAAVWRRSEITALEEGEGGLCRVRFKKKSKQPELFGHVVYCLGGSSPTGFLRDVGLRFDSNYPELDPSTNATEISGLYLAGDLAQQGKGSIITAFNTGHRIVQQGLCRSHFECLPPANLPPPRPSL